MGHNTREKLLLTAMRLYGSQGIHAVSLRTIGAEAGSRNSAAMHYHFKNKLGIIDALVEYIFQHIYAIGAELEVYRRVGEGVELREAIKLSLMPLVELERRFPWGSDAMRFMSRLLTEANAELSEINNRHSADFFRKSDNYLRDLLPHLNDEERRLRMLFMSVNIFHGFAERDALTNTPFGDLSHLGDDALIDHLVDYLTGGLRAEQI